MRCQVNFRNPRKEGPLDVKGIRGAQGRRGLQEWMSSEFKESKEGEIQCNAENNVFDHFLEIIQDIHEKWQEKTAAVIFPVLPQQIELSPLLNIFKLTPNII